MLSLSAEVWLLLLVATALVSFAACGGIAQALDLEVRLCALRVETRRLRRRYLRERAKRASK
jgi:hypothetical protein